MVDLTLHDEEDLDLGVYAEDVGGTGRKRGMDGPTDVTFSVCLEKPPKVGEVVILQGNPPELEKGLAMHPCRSGNGRLWTATVVLDMKSSGGGFGPAGNSSAPSGGGGGMLGGLLGGVVSERPLFAVTYFIVNQDTGKVVQKDEKSHEETGVLKQFYYHAARYTPLKATEKDKEPKEPPDLVSFQLFVHDEILLLQTGETTTGEFLKRFTQLAQAPFAKKRFLLDNALEELITKHWGMDMRPPPFLVLAVAATLGHFRKQASSHGGFGGGWAGGLDVDLGMGGLSEVGAKDKDKEKEPPPSLLVCQWIVQHCPDRRALEEEEARAKAARDAAATAGGTADGAKDRPRGGADYGGNHQLKRLTELGVLHAADTLYVGEKSFEWLKLLSFLPEHQLPNAMSSSQVTEEAGKLEKSFLSAMGRVFDNISQRKEILKATPWGDTEAELNERNKQENEANQFIELYLGGLCRFCPCIECLRKFFGGVQKDHADQLNVVGPFVLNRVRSLCFGKEDKDELKAMLKEFPALLIDDVAVSLLTNSNHPSEALKAEEIVNFVSLVTQNRAAGHQLQQAMKRWLNRHFARSHERSVLRDDKGQQSDENYAKAKSELREQIKLAIRGWHLALQVPCFKQEEECLRLIVFDLTQASFFKDNDQALILDAMLELEDEIVRTRSVKHLEDELQRVMVRLTRDIIENPESSVEWLLSLLFLKPTEKRCYILEALIQMKQGNGNIQNILRNEPIWSRLLAPSWLKNAVVSQYEPLKLTQAQGQDILTRTARELERKDICLSELHTILQGQEIYERLANLLGIGGASLAQIQPSRTVINLFDNELQYLKVYVKLFCTAGNIQSLDLDSLVESISREYSTMKLKDAEKKFNGMPVRPHLEWMFSLRGSEVFLKIWGSTCGADSLRKDQESLKKTAQLTQEEVVSNIIPVARQSWEALSKSVETGQAVLSDIRWCVEMEWPKVQRELLLLEKTAPKAGPWSDQALDMTKAMRLANKLRQWAPSMLHLKEVLKQLFSDAPGDECAKELQDVVRTHETMWEMQLGSIIKLISPFKSTIETLTDGMQDYVIKLAEHDEALKHVLTHNDLDQFNRLMALVRPNTDDATVLNALASLGSTRTFLSETLYTKPPYKDLRKFLAQLSTLQVDEQIMSSLDSVQVQFEPLTQLLITQARTPGVQACYDLIKLTDCGVFKVICSRDPESQIRCTVDSKEYNYEFLSELRRQLLMTDIPADLEGVKNIDERMNEFVAKFSLLEGCGRCCMDLLNLGHFAYVQGQEILKVQQGEPVEVLQETHDSLEKKLADWTLAVEQARAAHYYLNYFTVCELCHLVKKVPDIESDVAWLEIWPLLCVVAPNADKSKLRTDISSNPLLQKLKSSAPGGEVDRLNALGVVFGECFEKVPLVCRPLEGIKQSKQLLQGDLLMRSMQTQDEGIPVFVCCADDASKVTELILSIYTRRERVPEAEELLLCSGNTTLEQIELLLWRFFSARKHRREDRLYCLGNVHLLPYVVQCGTVENLRRLEELFGGYNNASALVFVSGMQNQMLTNALNRHNIAVSVMPPENLRDAVQRVGELYHGRPIKAVAAKMNGVGKTHFILREMAEMQAMFNDMPIRHHIEIRETTNVENLVKALLNDPTDASIPTAIHIDLAHILPTYVDTLLFEVLIVGMLRDPVNCQVYHRRSVDFFFVEIPNTPEENTAKQLSFCLLLPRTYLAMAPERMDGERPVFEIVDCGRGDNLDRPNPVKVVFRKPKEPLEDALGLCAKTLEAMSKEAFNPKSKDFKASWRGKDAPAVELARAYELLHDVCCSDTSPPSFLIFTNFVKFMGALIGLAETWNMMNLQLLQNFDPGLKHFKHCFYRLLIETSRDFALRQVPKIGVAELSILAPPVGTLQRTTSGRTPNLGRTISRVTSGPAPSLNRTVSRTVSQNATTGADVETGGVGRIEITNYAKRFDQMPAWETMAHPIASFKRNEAGGVLGCNIISLSPSFLGTFIDRNLQNSLNLNDLHLEKDWKKVTHQEAVTLVHQVEGGDLLKRKGHVVGGPTEYVVTVDNLIKLLSIQQRLRYGLPVILMGETGCGKTALVKFLGSTLEFKLCTLDIHGGITDQDIIDFMEASIKFMNEGTHRGVLIFFDEINAANCMAMFKSIIIDRTYGNKVIPDKVRVISCCNPYRLRLNKEDENMGLVFQHHQADAGASGIGDPMKKLVYRVHPLPESLIDVVSDFGSLSEASEDLYIKAILVKELPNSAEEQEEYDMFMEVFKDLLCQSQSFVREVNNGERSVVSMRDIARAARVFKWFLMYYAQLVGDGKSPVITDESNGVMKIQVTIEMRPHLRSAVILTLGYCYHARLNRNHRWGYRKKICDTWKALSAKETHAVSWLDLKSEDAFNKQIMETQFEFVKDMNMDEGVSLNEALRENLFMLLVSIMNQIPILLIGKPGCSKSLAMEILQNNLNGTNSTGKLYRAMPNVDVFPYQCSPLSTPDAILKAFHQARKSNLAGSKTIVTVLLDEVGLAEESPHLPLKVLHKELEDLQGIACVGISNWALDAAKMSRCVTLYRPPPTVEDLIVTAEGMVASRNLHAYLKMLSQAFFEVYKTQRRPDFWGMREFYSTVRVINSELKLRASKGQEAALDPQVLMKTVMRNFGGCSADDLDSCIEEFFDRVGMDFEGLHKYSTTELITQNLGELDARHLMLLTKNNAALRLLFESGLLDHDKAEVMFGGTFPNDLSDVSIAMSLQRIKAYMQKPISLVMVHCDSLYESLYDLFNQHYMNFSGRRYVRIAHGSKSNLREVHKMFRVIVLTEISDAYFRLAPPLLNRFEKQIFLRKDLMGKDDEALLHRIKKFWATIQESTIGGVEEDAPVDEIEMQEVSATSSANNKAIAGYHAELLSSLAFVLRRSKKVQGKDLDELAAEAKRRITAVLTPEAVCIAAAKYSKAELANRFHGLDIVKEYFETQRHSDLPSFAEALIGSSDAWVDENGAQVLAMTYSPIRGKCGADLKQFASTLPTEVSLHDLSASTDLEKLITDFYNSVGTSKEGENHFLLIHADPVAANLRMIELCRFVCEKTRTRKMSEKTVQAKVFVILVVHLQRGMENLFSFDFDSQWDFVFLDSVEPSEDMGNMPLLGNMLNMPLIEVVKGLEFDKLLQQCFRSALSRLMYPHIRKPGDLQRQINLLLRYIEDSQFVSIIRNWILHILDTTPKNSSNPDAGSVGADVHWFAAMATAAQELTLAGTFRAALAGRISVLVTSLLTAFLAHLDRNAGLVLLNEESKRELWLMLSQASLQSPLSVRLHTEANSAITESAMAQHEVGTDAQTPPRPFVSKFPSSWFVSKSINAFRQTTEYLPKKEQLSVLTSQFQMSKLREVGFDPALTAQLLDDYLTDFAAMHLDYTERLTRDTQTSILRKVLERKNGGPLNNVLEVHQLFWGEEKTIARSVSLLNEVPNAVADAEKLIQTAPEDTLDMDMILLVQKTLTEELVTPPAEVNASEPAEFYRLWNRRKQIVSGLTNDFLATCKDQTAEKLQQLKSIFEPRCETLSLLLSQVAYPLRADLKLVRTFASELPSGKIRHSQTLLAIFNLAKHLASTDQKLLHVSSFAESWMLDVCLRDPEATSDLDKHCMRLLCSLAAGLPLKVEPSTTAGIAAGDFKEWKDFGEVCIAACPGGETIPRSSCLNLALLRKLLTGSDPESDARKDATNSIEELLREVGKFTSHNDTTFATKYAVLSEELGARKLRPLSDPSKWPILKLEEVFQKSGGSGPAKILRDVGEIRWMLSEYAAVLCKEPLDHTRYFAIQDKVDGLLQTNDDSLAAICRSMRLYLLKCVERKKGVSFVRGQLAEAPLCDAPWVIKWRSLHDIDFEKFIGAALVPKWNPFSEGESGKEYGEAKLAVLEMMTSTNPEKLDMFSATCRKSPTAKQKRFIGGLLLALSQEPGLLAALEEEGREPAWRAKLNKWLEINTSLPVTDQERMLLRIFAGDHTVITQLKCAEHLKSFSVKDSPRMEDLLRWRFLAHVAAVLIAAPSNTLLGALRPIMLEPAELVKGEPIFLPGMDEDIRNRVLKALLERGENIWKFKSHWYRCTACGYNFFIGECGRPMETAKCPECQKPIGGKDHEKTGFTHEDDEHDRSPEGYMLPPAEQDDKHVTFREIPASSSRAIRLLLHGAMYCGVAAHIPEGPSKLAGSVGMPRVFAAMVNSESQCTMMQDSEPQYIGKHFLNDWAQMVEMMSSNGEDLAAALHALLGSMATGNNMTEGNGDPAKGGAGAVDWSKLNLRLRNSWEETLEARYLTAMIKDYDSQLAGLFARYGGAAEDGKFVSELKETADVRDFPNDKRREEMPQVWAYRTPVTLESLHASMGVQRDSSTRLPVLSTVLQQQYFPIIKALGMLTGVFEWHQLVFSHFSGRISRSQASETTVRQVLDNFPPSDRQRWTQAFRAFESVWTIAWPFIDRHECLEIPEHLRKIMVSEDSSMVYCIMDSENEGICPLALTQWLVARHNELVQVVSNVLNYPARKVSSRLLGQHDTIIYDRDELMRFLQSRCVNYGDGGKLIFDLDQLERRLRREMSRPEIVVELRGFQWLGESFSQASELKTAMTQRPIPNEIMERIKGEISNPSLANACLQKVSMSVSFILKAGGGLSEEFSSEMLLSDYMSSVLCDRSADSLPSNTARAEVRLSQIDAFATLLKQIINADPMDMVDVRYKVDIPEEASKAIIAVKAELSSELTDTLAGFAEAYLGKNGGIGPDTALMETLATAWTDLYMLDQLELTTIKEKLPKDLKVCHWAALYRLLKK